jgi:hypothetical protein
MRPRRYGAPILLALCLALAPASARADSPFVSIDGYDRAGAGSVLVSSSIDPSGLTTSVHFEYALVAAPFCVGGGDSNQPHSTSSGQVVGAAVGIQPLKTTIGGLTGGQTYCLKLVADNGTVTESFFSALVPGIPDTTTSAVNSTGPGSITVRGLVDANGQQTTVKVRYDTDISWFCQHGGSGGTPVTAAASVDAGAAEGAVPVSVTLPALGPGQRLCVQIVATNASGFGSGPDARPVVVGAAELARQRLEGLGPTTSRSIASIVTVGQPATVHVEYAVSGPVSSEFCSTQGESGDPQSTTPDQQLVAATAAQTLVTALGPFGATGDRCFVYVLSNASATVRIFGGTFHAGGPELTTLAASDVAGTSATLHAIANPGGSTGLAHFELGLEGTAFCGSEGIEGEPSILSEQVALGGGTDPAPADIEVSGLLPLTPYCFRAVADNSRGRTFGTMLTFATGDPPQSAVGGGGTSGLTPEPPGPAPAAPAPKPAKPFSSLRAAKVQYDKRLAKLRFTAQLWSTPSAMRAELLYKGRLAGTLRRSTASGTVSATITLSAKTRKRLARARSAKLQLIVVVTPAGGKAITKKVFVTLRRAR